MQTSTIRVLMIEDNPVECALLRNLIRVAAPHRAADITEARSLEQALKRLAKGTFDLIVADLGLEDSRGPQTVMGLRQATRDTPIVVVTALDDYDSGTQAIEHGAQDYLIKGQITERDLGRAMRFALTRKAIEDRLYNEKERARATLAAIAEAVVTTDAAGHVVTINTKAVALCGWSQADAVGRAASEVLVLLEHGSYNPIQHPVEVATRPQAAGAALGSIKGRYLLRARDGRELIVDISATAIADREGAVGGSILIVHDTTHDYEMLSRFSYQARHDALTGLPNRYEFERTLRNLCDDAVANNSQHALLYIDLDHFKRVNDTGGHAAGDELLRQLGAVLRSKVRRSDMVARIGGDEFGVLLEHCDLERASSVAAKVIDGVNTFKLLWSGMTHTVGASVGVCDITARHADVVEVMCVADAASIRAKQIGRNHASVHAWDERALAVGNGVAEFQLAVLGETNLSVETRALSRAGESSPAAPAFIEFAVRYTPADGAPALSGEPAEAAQRLGLGEKYDRWLVNQAFAAMVRLHATGNDGAVYGVSITPSTTSNVAVVSYFVEQAAELSISPSQVCFQIDELSLMTQPAQTTEFARALRANGFLVALDRFTGTLASFEYLRHLSLNYLKLAPSLNAGSDAEELSHDRAVVKAMQSYAQEKGLRVVLMPADPERTARVFDAPELQNRVDKAQILH